MDQERRYATPQTDDEPAPQPAQRPRQRRSQRSANPQPRQAVPYHVQQPSTNPPRRQPQRPQTPQIPQTPQTSYQPRQPERRRQQPPQKRPPILWHRVILLVLCVGVMIYAGSQLVMYAIESINTHRNNAQLQALYTASTEAPAPQVEETPVPTSAPTPVPTAVPARQAARPTATPQPTPRQDFQYIGKTTRKEMQELWSINHDLVGWLNIPGVVDLPVVYRDNDYYLKRDFYKKRSNAGTLFLDVLHPLRPENQYLVIHGHNMKDGSMFGLLAHYEDRNYAAKHPTIYWSTLYREEVYKVFAVLVVPTDYTDPHFVPYLGTPKFSSANHFDNFINQVRKNARYLTNEKVTYNDALLTLSTCLDDDRIVVLCKRTSPN